MCGVVLAYIRKKFHYHNCYYYYRFTNSTLYCLGKMKECFRYRLHTTLEEHIIIILIAEALLRWNIVSSRVSSPSAIDSRSYNTSNTHNIYFKYTIAQTLILYGIAYLMMSCTTSGGAGSVITAGVPNYVHDDELWINILSIPHSARNRYTNIENMLDLPTLAERKGLYNSYA